ncbi:drug/metabolite transporter (DMT)-like permease [Pacificibacter maritimus]|uniref:Drug/metabolite transporter (DMT)-like permease n=1 Tax=Pacificibacter maritimus TaxID=762213 RepID=A0A3N4UUI9_9RHOB|nr:DMT family transporter [Pacificibacter maritimus]RPE71241.1 drug/metabolite transporter (DMT)-like permease [Pacificibacter maritimus]
MKWFSYQSPSTQGILFVMLSVGLFSLMDAFAKQLGTQVSLAQVLWARYFGQLLIILLICRHRAPRYLATPHLRLQIFRSLMQLGAAACFFTALKYQGLAEATAVADLAPILITIAAAIILGERIGPRRIFGILAALFGAMIIIRPGTDVFSIHSLWPLGSALCIASFSITTRYIGKTESALTPQLYTGLVCGGLMCLVLPFYWVRPDMTAVLMMLCVGSIGTGAQLMMLKAYSTAPASVVAPFTYAGLITATLWGVIFFDQWPDLWTCIGALVIVAAGLYVWHRETRRTA